MPIHARESLVFIELGSFIPSFVMPIRARARRACFASISRPILVYNELQKGDCNMKVQTSMRIEEATFNEAKAILASLGMNFTDAVNIFVSMVVQTKGLPFEVKLPNAETLQAMQEVRDGKNIDDFKIEELRQ
jgi:DNA-damage-inducible protein J